MIFLAVDVSKFPVVQQCNTGIVVERHLTVIQTHAMVKMKK